ncbi:hypothetical protein PJM44_04505 [Mycobacterium kansasii]
MHLDLTDLGDCGDVIASLRPAHAQPVAVDARPAPAFTGLRWFGIAPDTDEPEEYFCD